MWTSRLGVCLGGLDLKKQGECAENARKDHAGGQGGRLGELVLDCCMLQRSAPSC